MIVRNQHILEVVSLRDAVDGLFFNPHTALCSYGGIEIVPPRGRGAVVTFSQKSCTFSEVIIRWMSVGAKIFFHVLATLRP